MIGSSCSACVQNITVGVTELLLLQKWCRVLYVSDKLLISKKY